MDITAHPKDHPGEPNKFNKDWAEGSLAMRHLVMKNDEDIIRAYSMASYPAEGRKIMFNVRVAAPPWDRDKNTWTDINPGVASSYIFGCKPGDKVTLSGPYGEFFAKETDREMCFVGGGAGMAPMRSHIFDQLKRLNSKRKISFWYGARSLREAFYMDEYEVTMGQYRAFLAYLSATGDISVNQHPGQLPEVDHSRGRTGDYLADDQPVHGATWISAIRLLQVGGQEAADRGGVGVRRTRKRRRPPQVSLGQRRGPLGANLVRQFTPGRRRRLGGRTGGLLSGWRQLLRRPGPGGQPLRVGSGLV